MISPPNRNGIPQAIVKLDHVESLSPHGGLMLEAVQPATMSATTASSIRPIMAGPSVSTAEVAMRMAAAPATSVPSSLRLSGRQLAVAAVIED